MRLKDKLKKKLDGLDKDIQSMRSESLQKKAEKQRKRHQKAKYLEPGTISYGMYNRQNIIGFMKDSIQRRKDLRNEKKK